MCPITAQLAQGRAIRLIAEVHAPGPDLVQDHMTVDQGAGVEGELLKGKARQEATLDLLVEATVAGVEAVAIASARVMTLTLIGQSLTHALEVDHYRHMQRT